MTVKRRHIRATGAEAMSLIDDARRIAENDGSDGDTGGCIFCGWMPHTPACPWLSMSKIVAALEAAERVIDEGDGPSVYSGQWDRANCMYCSARLFPGEHADGCPWQVLIAALRGEP